MLAQRGFLFSYASIRSWCEKFGRQYARKIRRQRGRMGDVWLLDEGSTDGQTAYPVGKMKRGHTLKHVTP
jgi:transposase-like protein